LDTVYLEGVSISVFPFREKYLEATGSVFGTKKEEIQREFGMVSTELYNRAPGVFMASGALNTHRITIRGIGSRTPYSSNRIRAYLDDIPLTSGDGISTLEDQDILAIGSMEILKGPSSALYGSGLGGVIRLNSPYPENPGTKISLIAEGGSFNSQRYAFTGQFKKGNMAISGGISRTSTDGFRENSQYTRNAAFLNARYFKTRHQFSLTFSLVDLHSGIPSSLNEEDFLNHPEKAGGAWGSTGGFEEYMKVLGGARLESELGEKWNNSLILYASFADPYERRPFNILDERSSNIGFREFLEFDAGPIKLGAGMEFFNEWFDWKTFETLPEGQGLLLSDQNETRKYLNTFSYLQWRPAEYILVDAGLNMNLISYGLTTQYRIDSIDQSGSYNYRPILSPRIGISYLHGKHIRSYASAGHGFSAPSLEETLLPEGAINTSLRPESGWNFDLGNRGILFAGRLEYDLALYSILLEDLLVTERLAEDIFTGVNAGSTWNRGIELLVRGRLFQEDESQPYNVGLQLSYQLSKNTFREFVDDGIDYSGKELPGIPGQMLRTEITGRIKGLEITVQHGFNGAQWMNDNNDEKYEAYQLLHLQLQWNINPVSIPFGFKIYGGIRNIFDRHFASMILVNAPSFGGRAPRYYYPGMPRYFFLGLRINFQKLQGS
jgi:iron complex outermembrane receptor protein